jgi:glutamine synthetase
MLAAGLDGIDGKLDCPPAVNNLNIYQMETAELEKRGIKQLPGSLDEALEELRGCEVIRDALGEFTMEVFLRAKEAEANEYRTRVMDWEIKNYLETA